ncbi:hypothetical protein C882_2072 [Caenispirillum salinarum AK4]|uniref:Uncharacterized protein n=1 Tax=Caenispirillum salinarum AK4 TaxID=1238182 RepID=K9GQ46_9PROT|nr:hypothetical protein [Caenispirillum salinarum]EKV26849.1 hypothetical protein C882_2072 [Caenispirillum salinarum AK4]
MGAEGIPARPRSLADVAARAIHTGDYTSAMKEFIDTLIAEAPVLPESAYATRPPLPESAVLRAHLGGMAEHLAALAGRAAPDWCREPVFFLDAPHVMAGAHADAIMRAQTPPAFARRNLFCGPVLLKLEAVTGRRSG